MSKIAVYFPGIGHHCDKPLLYYSRNIACEMGYKNFRNVSYTYKAGNIRGNDEKMKEAYEALFSQTEAELSDIVWSEYDDMLFISKLLPLKRNRMDRFIQLLSRLEKGEQCMSFKEFDLSDYINALEDFKSNRTEEVVRHWGSIENFDMFIQKIRSDEEHLAQLAIRQFGSVEKYTESMKHNLEHFSELMDNMNSQIPEAMRTEDKFFKSASHREEDVTSEIVQNLVKEIIAYARENAPSELVGDDDNYCRMIIEVYSNDCLKAITDAKYGTGSCDYIAETFLHYLHKN